MRTCKECEGEALPRRSYCRLHYNEYQARWRSANHERLRAWDRERRKSGAYREYEREYRQRNLDAIRTAERARRYGLSVGELEDLLSSHDGTCAICGSEDPADPRWGQWSIDHCHTSGKVRGLLCGHCNKAIGLLRDDPVIVQRAVEYLSGAVHPQA